MPIYEFWCEACGRRYSALVGMTQDSGDVACEVCGEVGVRLVSRFRRGRSEDERVDEVADRLDAMDEPDSPTQVRSMVREMGKALDDDFSDQAEEMFEADMDGGETD